MNFGFLKDNNGNKIYINDNSIYHEGKKLNEVIDKRDGLPPGLVINYDGDTIPNGFEEIIGEKVYGEYTLYESASGSTGDIVLSDSRENYDYIKVFVDFGEYCISAETNTNRICISGITLNEDGTYTKSVILLFNGINCTKLYNYSAVNRANEYNRYETDTHKVIKILGYK